jgi:large subunit ribosomal protein L23
MKKFALYDIIRKPLLSEKSNLLEKNNKQYAFIVSSDASKNHIKRAVETIFGISVLSVNTLNVQGKKKVFKGRKGQQASYKKAIVTTKDKKKIEFLKGI